MKTSSPSKFIWVLALIVGIIGIIAHFIKIQYVSEYEYWLLLAGYALLVLGTTFKSL
jgi:hypothetical protein